MSPTLDGDWSFMQISYHGQSCFQIKGERGTLVTDPFDEKAVGIPLARLAADIVTVSHNHSDHNAVDKIKGDTRKTPFVIDFAGEYEIGGISVFGIKTFHDQVQGAEKGKNIVFKMVMDGMLLCHLGDLAHQLSEEQLKSLGMVDILFLPVGGPSSLNAEEAIKVAKAINPSILIPMHFAGPGYPVASPLHKIDEFLQVYGGNHETVDKLRIERERLPEETQLIVIERS